jgi:hypothetical protein
VAAVLVVKAAMARVIQEEQAVPAVPGYSIPNSALTVPTVLIVLHQHRVKDFLPAVEVAVVAGVMLVVEQVGAEQVDTVLMVVQE